MDPAQLQVQRFDSEAKSKLADLWSSYGSGISTARKMQSLSLLQAARSVLLARLRYGIGPRFHSLFEFARSGIDWQAYLLNEPLKVILRRLNPAAARKIVGNKFTFFEHCVSRNIETIPLICAIDGGHEASSVGSHLVRDAEHWCRLIDEGPNELFLKHIHGTWGIGAFGARRGTDGEWAYKGTVGSSLDLYDFVTSRMHGQRGWIVQPRIRTHSALQGIMSPAGLGTIRVVTALRNDQPSILFAVLKILIGQNATDNFLHGTSGNLIAAIDLETGRLRCGRASNNRHWPNIVDVDISPESGERITGLEVPLWNEAKDLVIRAHATLPDLVTLGWDVAVTDQGPLVVEANGTYDIDIIQVALKRGVKPDLDFLLKNY